MEAHFVRAGRIGPALCLAALAAIIGVGCSKENRQPARGEDTTTKAAPAGSTATSASPSCTAPATVVAAATAQGVGWATGDGSDSVNSTVRGPRATSRGWHLLLEHATPWPPAQPNAGGELLARITNLGGSDVPESAVAGPHGKAFVWTDTCRGTPRLLYVSEDGTAAVAYTMVPDLHEREKHEQDKKTVYWNRRELPTPWPAIDQPPSHPAAPAETARVAVTGYTTCTACTAGWCRGG